MADRRVRLIAWLLVIGLGLDTVQAVSVWRDEVSLWRHAAEVSPLKPRPALNYARALLLSGQWAESERAHVHVLALAEQPHVPAFDRTDAIGAAQANLTTLHLMRAVRAFQ